MCSTNEQNLVEKYSRISEKLQFSCWGVLFWRTLYTDGSLLTDEFVCGRAAVRSWSRRFVHTTLGYSLL